MERERERKSKRVANEIKENAITITTFFRAEKIKIHIIKHIKAICHVSFEIKIAFNHRNDTNLNEIFGRNRKVVQEA